MARPAVAAPSDGSGPLDTPADLAAALRFEARIPQHTFSGMVTGLYFDKWPDLDPTAVVKRMDAEPDSGNYTGVYLAGQSWRYAQAKAELRRIGVRPLAPPAVGDSETAAFWKQQRDEARARGRQIVNYYRVLINIARNWKTTFDPKVDQSKEPTEYGWLDYGGGIVPGEAGLLMRTCSPEDASPQYADLRFNYGGRIELIGPLPWEDGRDWYCLGGTSRDSYAGTIFGLSVALDFLATPENRDLRRSLAHDLMAMADYAIKYLWFQPRPHGVVANPLFGHNDLEGPISPLFIQVPLHQLHLLQTARRAAAVVGDKAAKRKYDLLWKQEVATYVTSGALALSMVADAQNPHNDYYKYQLNLMSFFDVIRLERNARVRTELSRAMGVLDATLTDDGNAFFEAITYGLTGEPGRLREAVALHRQWLDYYAFHVEASRRGITPFLHTGRCSITKAPPPGAPVEKQPLACSPKNRVEMVMSLGPAGEVVVPINPGSGADLRSTEPLPVGVRRLADFLWQKDPTIVGGDHDVPWRGPSIDFLGTYWMLRYYSEIDEPFPAPLPVWPGPRFR